MSEPIKVGDLAIVIRPTPCCGNAATVGSIFMVSNFYTGQFGNCPRCGNVRRGTMARQKGDNDGWDISRLKRIPPLSELEGEKQKEDLREPA